MSDCIFCKIIKKEIPAKVVYENDKVLGFLDINPSHEIHVLFIPKTHISTLTEADVNDLSFIQDLYAAALDFAKAEKLTHHRTLINTGEPFQEVFHVHLHLMSGDRLKAAH